MITFFQEREIEKYLLEKKISGKLLTEIKDHMITEVLDIQDSESLSFEEAFEKMKMNWSKDMMMVRKNIFSRQKITRLAYGIDKTTNKNLFLKSLLFAIAFIGFEIILAFFVNRNLYLGIHKIVKAAFFYFAIYYCRNVYQSEASGKNKLSEKYSVKQFCTSAFCIFSYGCC